MVGERNKVSPNIILIELMMDASEPQLFLLLAKPAFECLGAGSSHKFRLLSFLQRSSYTRLC